MSDPFISLGAIDESVANQIDKSIERGRPLGDDDLNLLMSKVVDEWISSLWDDPGNEIDDSFLDAEKKDWAIERVLKS